MYLIPSPSPRYVDTDCYMYLLGCEYLEYADGLVEHRLRVGEVVGGGQGLPTEVGLQQQVGLRVGAVERVSVDRQRKLLRQLPATTF